MVDLLVQLNVYLYLVSWISIILRCEEIMSWPDSRRRSDGNKGLGFEATWYNTAAEHRLATASR